MIGGVGLGSDGALWKAQILAACGGQHSSAIPLRPKKEVGGSLKDSPGTGGVMESEG